MVMFVRQPGLARVYGQILGFDGDEFYIASWARPPPPYIPEP